MKVTNKLFIYGFTLLLMGCSVQNPTPVETKDKLTFIMTKTECHVRATNKDISGEVIIPSSFKGLPVTLIIANGFYNCKDITSVSIPKTITNIDINAFYGCSSLKEVSFASDSALFSLGYRSFAKSGVNTITLPNNLTSLKDNVFEDCLSLTNVNISTESKLTSIGDYSFKNCEKLESLYLPKTLMTFNSNVFEGCSSLKSIDVDPSNEMFSTENGIVYNEAKTKIVVAPKLLSGNIILPESLIEIPNEAFANCTKLSSLVLPESIKTIPNRTFYNCENLTNVTFMSEVERIGDQAFSNCTNLLGVNVGESFTYLGYEAFSNCSSLEEFSLPSSLEEMGSRVFQNCKNLSKLEIDEDASYETIDEYAFAGCSSLTSFTIIKSVNGIHSTAFDDTSSMVEFIVIKGNRNFSSSSGVLYGSKGTSIVRYPQAKQEDMFRIRDEIKSIKSEAFRGNPYLKEITFFTNPKLVSFPALAFQNCISLERVNVPKSMSVIATNTFEGCDNLNTITVSPSNLTYASFDGVLYNKAKNIIMMIPNAKSGELVIAKELMTLDEFAVVDLANITSISFEEDSLLKTLEPYSISECESLTEIHLPNSLKLIKSKAFDALNAIEDIYYEGTIEEFTEITKQALWMNSPLSVIHCSNGDYNI